MRKALTRALVVVLAIGLASFAFAEAGSFSGWVTDSHCGAKGANASHASCATKCVKEHGAKWALYDPAAKETYILSGKEDPSRFAGQEVTVKGTLDKETKTIEATSIEAATTKN
jgi:hypothetical protein